MKIDRAEEHVCPYLEFRCLKVISLNQLSNVHKV